MSSSEHDHWGQTVSDHRTRQAASIIEAAMDLIASDGMSALTMSAIADRAGVSRQTLYRYYPDVEAVLTAAMTASSEIDRHIEDLIGDGAPKERLDNLIDVVLESAGAGHPTVEQFGDSLPPKAREAVRRHAEHLEAVVTDIVKAGIADGSFTADLVPSIDGPLIYRFIVSAHDVAASDADATRHLREALHRLVGVR